MENVIFAQKTDRGNLRAKNEDACWPEGDKHPYLGSPHGLLFIVADGIGGQGAGDLASQTAVEIIPGIYYQKSTKTDPAQRLVEAIQAAQQKIRLKANVITTAKEMGTTVVAAVIKDNQLIAAWAGDSRLYIVPNEDGQLRLLTRDHNLLWPKIVAGQISWEEIHHHPLRSHISNALTAQRQTVEVEIEQYPLKPGDRVLLCTDGLTGEVPEKEIETILTLHPPKKAVGLLEKAAKAPKSWSIDGNKIDSAGGEDNITSLVIQIPGGKPPILAHILKISWPMVRRAFLTVLFLLFISASLFWFPGPKSLPSPTEPAATSSIEPQLERSVATPAPTMSISEEVRSSNPTPESLTPEPTLHIREAAPTLAPVPETPTLIPTPTTILVVPPSPTSTASPTEGPTVETTREIVLVEPQDNFIFVQNQSELEFKWRWGEEPACETLPQGYGFELRIWPYWPDDLDNPPLGAMDAIHEQENISCDPSTGIRSYLLGDVKSAEGVKKVNRGEFLWNVVVVQLEPDYVDKPLVEATPYLLKFAANLTNQTNKNERKESGSASR